MFGFGKKHPVSPIGEDSRLWIESSMIWLISQFGDDKLSAIKTLTPSKEDFPIDLDGSKQMAEEILKIVAMQMEVDLQKINLGFYNDHPFQFNTDIGFPLHSEQYEDQLYSSGQYNSDPSTGLFSVLIETGQLKAPQKLIATLAHEIAHIKLLGEKRLQENDEHLTDLTTVFFGLGIFGANASFEFKSGTEGWSSSRQGYLPPQEWGYALATYSYLRQEQKPDWIKHLSRNIQSDFVRSSRFIKYLDESS